MSNRHMYNYLKKHYLQFYNGWEIQIAAQLSTQIHASEVSVKYKFNWALSQVSTFSTINQTTYSMQY